MIHGEGGCEGGCGKPCGSRVNTRRSFGCLVFPRLPLGFHSTKAYVGVRPHTYVRVVELGLQRII